MFKAIERWLDRLFGYDKCATKDDVKKLHKALDELQDTILRGRK